LCRRHELLKSSSSNIGSALLVSWKKHYPKTNRITTNIDDIQDGVILRPLHQSAAERGSPQCIRTRGRVSLCPRGSQSTSTNVRNVHRLNCMLNAQTSDWQEVTFRARGVWKSTTTIVGEQFVTTTSVTLTLLSSATLWDMGWWCCYQCKA